MCRGGSCYDLSMSLEAIVAYVNTERERGIPDAIIRAELEKNGWKESDISEVIPRGATTPTVGKMSLSQIQLSGAPERTTLQLLGLGMILFLASSALLFVLGAADDLNNQFVFGAFAVTHIVNAGAAFFLFIAVWKLSRSIWFHIWIGLLSAIVALFAISSFLHFASLATDVSFFNEFSRFILGDDYLPLFIYFIFLPLQAVVFLLLAITLWVLRYVRVRNGGEVPLLRQLLIPVGLFFVMALLAIGDLYLVLDNVSLRM